MNKNTLLRSRDSSGEKDSYLLGPGVIDSGDDGPVTKRSRDNGLVRDTGAETGCR